MHTNNHPSSMAVDRKRKRRHGGFLRVRFCTEPSVIIDTYSPIEYNRCGLFPDADDNKQLFDAHHHHYNNNNNNNNNNHNHNNHSSKNNNITLTLSFGFMTPATTTSTPPLIKKTRKGDKKKKPQLTIDTSGIHHGPLYFTNMTTHPPKNAAPLATTFQDADDPDARITMENTEINRRCLIAAV